MFTRTPGPKSRFQCGLSPDLNPVCLRVNTTYLDQNPHVNEAWYYTRCILVSKKKWVKIYYLQDGLLSYESLYPPPFPHFPQGGVSTTTDQGGATTTDQSDVDTTTDQGGVGTTTDQGGVGTTTDQGGVGAPDQLSQGGVGTTDRGGVSTANQGGVGTTDQGGVGTTDQGDAGTTDEGGDVTDTSPVTFNSALSVMYCTRFLVWLFVSISLAF